MGWCCRSRHSRGAGAGSSRSFLGRLILGFLGLGLIAVGWVLVQRKQELTNPTWHSLD